MFPVELSSRVPPHPPPPSNLRACETKTPLLSVLVSPASLRPKFPRRLPPTSFLSFSPSFFFLGDLRTRFPLVDHVACQSVPCADSIISTNVRPTMQPPIEIEVNGATHATWPRLCYIRHQIPSVEMGRCFPKMQIPRLATLTKCGVS